MDKDAVLRIVQRFQQALLARGVKASKIVLFGSFAKGSQHEGSDIDLVVISDGFVNKGYWERIGVLSSAICELWEPIEAIAMTPEEWEKGDSMIAQFARKGELVYSA